MTRPADKMTIAEMLDPRRDPLYEGVTLPPFFERWAPQFHSVFLAGVRAAAETGATEADCPYRDVRNPDGSHRPRQRAWRSCWLDGFRAGRAR